MKNTSNNALVAATMRLFNCVPDLNKEASDSFVIVKEYGVILSPSAAPYEAEIRRYLKANKVSDTQFNQTFYATPDEVKGKTQEERLRDQLTHYFTTYGLRAMGLESSFMYLPNNWEALNLPERVKFKVVVASPPQELKERCLKMLSSGVALKQETIEDIITTLLGCLYIFDGSEVVNNNEARIIIADKTGILPSKGDDLFRYLFFKATGSSLIINNRGTMETIKSSLYTLPELTDSQLKELAKSFNRRKAYWLALKKANPKANSTLVNKLSKLSKKLHQGLPADILSSLTSTKFKEAEISKAAEKANTFRVIRALNAILEYSKSESKVRLYKVRNGKSFVKEGGDFKGSHTLKNLLKAVVSERIRKDVSVYIPDGITYSLPSSEKQFSSSIPDFSYIEVDKNSDKDLLVGIYWENPEKSSYTDFDLSCNSLGGGRVGWNCTWSNSELVYSGDITNAPNGAAEWFIVKDLKNPWLISTNLYSGSSLSGFKIMVGYGKALKDGAKYRNYFISPEDVLFVADANTSQRQTTLGVLAPVGDKIRFTLINRGGGNRNVSCPGVITTSTIEALIPKSQTCLSLNEFVNLCRDPFEADIDLSPGKVNKDSILSLIEPGPLQSCRQGNNVDKDEDMAP